METIEAKIEKEINPRIIYCGMVLDADYHVGLSNMICRNQQEVEQDIRHMKVYWKPEIIKSAVISIEIPEDWIAPVIRSEDER